MPLYNRKALLKDNCIRVSVGSPRLSLVLCLSNGFGSCRQLQCAGGVCHYIRTNTYVHVPTDGNKQGHTVVYLSIAVVGHYATTVIAHHMQASICEHATLHCVLLFTAVVDCNSVAFSRYIVCSLHTHSLT